MPHATHASPARIRPRLSGPSGCRRWVLAVFLAVLVLVALPAPRVQASFGFKQLGLTFSNEDGSTATQAGSHPFTWTTELALNTVPGAAGKEAPDQSLRNLRIQLPPGLVGTPALVPRCSHADFTASACPASSGVGEIELDTELAKPDEQISPLYSLIPRPGAAAELGFQVAGIPMAIVITINPDPPHNLVASLAYAPNAAAVFGAVLRVRGAPGAAPLITLPRSCGAPLGAIFEADSWENPGAWTPPAPIEAHDSVDPSRPLALDGCGALSFEPTLGAAPTTPTARSPSGLDVSIDAPVAGLVSPTGTAAADVREAVLRLPEGMTVNPSIAQGLGACTPGDYAREAVDSAAGAGCPDASKLGSATVESPLLEGSLAGSLFVAEPDDPATARPGAENPFDSLLALYVVFRDPQRGILLKQAIGLDADAGTGRLTATIPDLPQLPFSHLELHVRAAGRSPLVTPPACGAHAVDYTLTPSSGAAPLSDRASFDLDRDCGAPGFKPGLAAGTTDSEAGAASTFVVNLSRGDGEENPSQLSLTLPQGIAARLAGVPVCPEGLAAAGSCPPGSRLGSARIAAGAGGDPVWIPDANAAPSPVFLAGPYAGAPFSLAIAVPAQAGPFDLGPVVTRAAVFVDPETGQARIQLDPLPQILRGVPIAYRAIHLVLDRPGFIHNPTSCAASAVQGSVRSAAGTVAPVSDRFEVGGCRRLGFEPKVHVRLLGPTRRGAHPRFRTALTPRRGDANLRRVAVTLPGTELLDSSRIRTVCSRVRFAAGSCPAGSVYGHATAWTPLLDAPLEGPVYLRAGKHDLPDLVASLRGQLRLDLVGHIDSVGGRIRTSFESVPDVPLKKFVLTLGGGRRGLLVNTGGLCAGAPRAAVGLNAQNGGVRHRDPVVKTDCGQ
jgi:hypothetical protein